MVNYKIINEIPLCFKIEDIGDRIDCGFNNPRLIDFERWLDKQKNIESLSKLSMITDGSHEVRAYVDDGVLFLRIINIKEDGIDLENVRYISERENREELKRSELLTGDVLITKTGTLGVTFVVPKDFGKVNISADLGLVRIRKEYKEVLLPEFLSLFLSSELFLKQIYKNLSGSSRDRIVLKNIKKLKIILPSIKKQEEIIKKVNFFQNNSEKGLLSFKENVNKIKKYLDFKIKFDLNKQTNIFVLRESELKDRLDCTFYIPEYKKLILELNKINNGDIEVIKANSLDFNKPIKKEDFNEDKNKLFKYLDIGNTDKRLGDILNYEEDILLNLPKRARQKANSNDVLIPRPIGSTDTIIKIDKNYENQLYSTGFIAVRNENENEAILLKAVLMSDILQKQFYFLQAGSLQPEITPSNFKKYVLIILPKGDFKNKMLKDTKEYFSEAKVALNEYEENKKKAREIFLQEVLK